MNLRRSVLDTSFLRLKEWADVGLDMTAPRVAFTLTPTTPTVWYPTDWIVGQNTQQDAASGLYFRVHRILIGPDPAAALALAPGRWLIWRQLTDVPEIPTGLVAGTLTMV